MPTYELNHIFVLKSDFITNMAHSTFFDINIRTEPTESSCRANKLVTRTKPKPTQVKQSSWLTTYYSINQMDRLT